MRMRMRIDDEGDARAEASTIVRELVDQHGARLRRLQRPADVWTELSAPLANARRRFNKRVNATLRDRGIFEAAVHEELVAPIEARLTREQADEDRGAVKVAEYRHGQAAHAAAPPVPVADKPERQKQPRTESRATGANRFERSPSERPVDPLADQRSTSMIFIVVGALAAVAMGAFALQHSANESLASRVQRTYVPARCTIVDINERVEEGGGHLYEIRFEHVVGDKHLINNRYSPDVAEVSTRLYNVGDNPECYCDPRNSAECFLYKGQETNREQVPWAYIVLFPALLLGIGLWMRFSPTVLDSGD
jgi:hypothetical protein